MDLKNYQLSEYEEYLLERTGTENVAFNDGMVYVTYHSGNNSTELMKSNDDEFVTLCINSKDSRSMNLKKCFMSTTPTLNLSKKTILSAAARLLCRWVKHCLNLFTQISIRCTRRSK